MNSLMVLGICAIIVQFSVERLKDVVPETYRAKATPWIALVFSIAVSMTTKLGIFGAMGVLIEPVGVDYLITGIAYSGGAVAFNELIKLISELRPSNKL